ncbi:hypothetical protein HLH27_15775 [Gluconacetobacter takamatsuzukensis]|uniref:Uncharacterized protein n=1 Tax=Gluconacetobacter takamatsuzukensis TaxID=1286190 RepID=A0A7W4KGB5_9PROT|nr:hypothetical protein [Gluconacetobacter takamatsuzukensis]
MLADYLGDDEKGRGYIALMRRAADHGIYDRIVRWGTSPRPEATTVAVVRMLLPSTDRMQMANILGMSLESLEERLALVLPRGVRDYARTLSCRLPHWHRF